MKLLVSGLVLVLAALSAVAQNGISPAEALIRNGRFGPAEESNRETLTRDSSNVDAIILEGRLLLLANRLEESRRCLEAASQLRPFDSELKLLLAEIAYRQDDFDRSAKLNEEARRPEKAEQLRSFHGLRPYELPKGFSQVDVPFVNSDPMPLIKVRVNGSDKKYFLIDTGGSEVIIDPDFAKEIGAKSYGAVKGMYGGGKTAMTTFGRIDSIQLGSLVIKNLPVNLLSTKKFSPAALGKPVSGIIGTCLLYHFQATLDYPGGQLLLRARSTTLPARTAKSIDIPFWMAGDHFMVAEGTLNDSKSHLFLVDSGLAGAAFTGPKSIMTEGHVKINEASAQEGAGGGGMMKIIPFTVANLSLGSARQSRLLGIYGPFPPALETSLGFHLGGLISHQFLRNYAVTFDFNSMTIRLESPTRS